MSTKPFSDEEMFVLRQNPFTFKVTKRALVFTNEFKELFVTEYNEGKLPRQILMDHGYDPAILGNRRIWSLTQHIREQYDKYGEFYEGPFLPTSRTAKKKLNEDELGTLRNEVDYLKQELAFLKKIISIRNTRK